jgi:hypothetical protein
MAGLENWERAGNVQCGIHIGNRPELDNIPLGHWSEMKSVAHRREGDETWLLFRPLPTSG